MKSRKIKEGMEERVSQSILYATQLAGFYRTFNYLQSFYAILHDIEHDKNYCRETIKAKSKK